MKNLYKAFLIFAAIAWAGGTVNAQDCGHPQLLCPGSSPGLNTESGLPTPLPASYCFQTENAVYLSFTTLDNVTFPGLDYSDSTATIQLSGLNCAVDTALGQSVNLAIFGATDPCDDATYDPAMSCVTGLVNDTSITLYSLLPATTYYVVISGALGSDPGDGPAECNFNVEVSGPAVTYDLQGDPFEQFIFLGQTAEFSVNPNLGPYDWTGENLDSPGGSTNSATPQVPDQAFWYSATTTIDGCEYTADFVVNVRPAILVYNVMTPNGDGINDFFEIGRNALWPNAQIYIYDRWGQKVFQTVHYQNDWDGAGLPAGVYYYVIELNEPNIKDDTYTGSITIIR